ncbi:MULTISPECIES: RNA polymerase sigma factor [Sphingobacterium]|uniref:RNA polymerase sigma factor n=1 Tax=Sphingobacterium TaxID=28453 RepID=UPI0013DC048D|nr:MULTISPECIES: RNA polymerase sigma-70 factor [unclassified Sphingobacterium]
MKLHTHYNDQQLTELMQADDHAAFTEIFNRYSALIYSHAYNKLRNEEEARDVVQEMFINLWIKRASLDPQNNLSGYLYTAVRNGVLNLIKHKKVVTNYADLFSQINLQYTASTDHLIREKQFAALIEAEIAALPPRMREVFELRHKEHLSNKEIAEKMQIAESTVADQMKKALRILKPKVRFLLIICFLFNN